MYVQPVFILVNVLNKKTTTSQNMPPKWREVVVNGDGNCFYRAAALWKDEISDEEHEETPWSSDSLSCHFSPRTPQRILSGEARSRELRQKL